MRTLSLVIGATTLAACAGSDLPNQFSGPAAGGGGTVLNCVSERLAGLGYQPMGGSATAGAVRLERENDEPFWRNMIGINDSVDVLDASTQGSQLQVTAYSQILRGDERLSAPPSAQARQEAQDVLDACT